MRRLRVLSVIGTRPEAVKMAPVLRRLSVLPEKVESHVCVTAQQREMLDQVLTLFGIVPDSDLDLMLPDQTPTQVAVRVMAALEPLLHRLQPDWVLVQGDTTTVLAAAIAAHYQRFRVGHVEAGLRTYDRGNPFPEEMNRVVVDQIADLCFAATEASRENLLREGIPAERVFVTGNTVIDTLLETAGSPLPPSMNGWFGEDGLAGFLRQIADNGQKLILVTAHRRENHGEPIRRICRAIGELARAKAELQFVYPVHRNPQIWQPVHEILQGWERVRLVPPVDYATLIHLIRHSALVLTDSGGIQEEAPSLGVPVLVLRETTERPEGVVAGTSLVVGTNPDRIVSETAMLLDDSERYQAMARAVNPYGDGRASERIVQVLLEGTCAEFRRTSPEREQSPRCS